jgi:hypothetical protein
MGSKCLLLYEANTTPMIYSSPTLIPHILPTYKSEAPWPFKKDTQNHYEV